MPWEKTKDYIRSGHGNKGSFDPKSFRTITVGNGIKAIVGCPRGKYIGGRCKVGMRVQSYLFPKSKGWTVQKAKAWVSKHKKKGKKKEDEEDEITKGLSKEQIRTKLVVLKKQRSSLWEQDSKLWKKIYKEEEVLRIRHRAEIQKVQDKYKPQLEKIGEEIDKVGSEIRALEYALGKRI